MKEVKKEIREESQLFLGYDIAVPKTFDSQQHRNPGKSDSWKFKSNRALLTESFVSVTVQVLVKDRSSTT